MDWNNDNRQTKHSDIPDFFWEIISQYSQIARKKLLSCLLPVTLCNNSTAPRSLMIEVAFLKCPPLSTFCGDEDKANYFFYVSSSQPRKRNGQWPDPHFPGFKISVKVWTADVMDTCLLLWGVRERARERVAHLVQTDRVITLAGVIIIMILCLLIITELLTQTEPTLSPI